MLREAIGIHTCDRRSSKFWIHEKFPSYVFETGFSASDPLWVADRRESGSSHVVRMRTLLDDVFSSDANTWISFTSHGGSIGAILRALGHRQFGLSTGGVIPVLVKAETISSARPSTTTEAWGTAPRCSSTAASFPVASAQMPASNSAPATQTRS